MEKLLEIDAATMPYYQLNGNKLKAGDVILEAGAGKLPWLIKLFDQGKASPSGKVFYHTLIFIGHGHLIEATRKGVGVISSRLFITDDPNDYYILQHPENNEAREDGCFSKFQQESFFNKMWAEVGKEYNFLRAIIAVFYKFRRLMGRETREYDSFFCSQLVAEAYHRLGFPLFKKNTSPWYVTPDVTP